MTSYLIVGLDKKKRQKEIEVICKGKAINSLDITLIEKENTKTTSQSIGIEDIKNIHKKIFLKAIKSQQKAVVIEDAQLLTTEAQNALLKVLEEPPANTIILLSANAKETMLGTIISRCQIITVDASHKALSDKEKEEYEAFINNVETMSVGERLKKAEQLAKDKDKALKWLTRCIIYAHERLYEDKKQIEIAKILRSLQNLHTLLQTTNANPRLVIEYTLLQLQNTR